MTRASRIPQGRQTGDVARALEQLKRDVAASVTPRACVVPYGDAKAAEVARKIDLYRRELATGGTVRAAAVPIGDRDLTDVANALEELKR